MKKRSSILIMFSFVALLGLASCKKYDPWGREPDGGSTTGTTSTTGTNNTDCFMKGTLVYVPCAVSDLNNLWILAEDGHYYQPCDASILTLMDYTGALTEGSKITFGFTKMMGGCPDETKLLCSTPWPAKTKIRLTCITPAINEDANTCKPIEKVNQINPYRGFAEILEASREGNCIKMLVRYSSAVPVESANFSLTWDGTIAKSNPATATLFLDYLPTGINSQIVQVEEISFDVSEISDIYGKDVKIKINGFDRLF